MHDFAADFEQTTRSVLLAGSAPGLAETSRGTVVFAKPGRMRWTYTEPEPSLVVSDGETLWLYSPELKEAQRLPVTRGFLTGAALEFLLGDGRLLDSFHVSADACSEGKGEVELRLEPRVPASYERLGLRVDARSGRVTGTTVVDVFGNETRIEFHDARWNQEPPDETFRFEPGPDVEIVDLGEGGAVD